MPPCVVLRVAPLALLRPAPARVSARALRPQREAGARAAWRPLRHGAPQAGARDKDRGLGLSGREPGAAAGAQARTGHTESALARPAMAPAMTGCDGLAAWAALRSSMRQYSSSHCALKASPCAAENACGAAAARGRACQRGAATVTLSTVRSSAAVLMYAGRYAASGEHCCQKLTVHVHAAILPRTSNIPCAQAGKTCSSQA